MGGIDDVLFPLLDIDVTGAREPYAFNSFSSWADALADVMVKMMALLARSSIAASKLQ